MAFAKPSQARYTMQQLYHLRRLLEENPLVAPAELVAAEGCAISQTSDGCGLRIYARKLSPSLNTVHQQLVEAPANASLQRLLANASGSSTEAAPAKANKLTPKNPYF